jgi:3-oxoacyl-[acyl-carrier-protein] synthase II
MIPYGSMRSNVVVTGMGCVSSLGLGVDTFVDRLLAGESGIRPITAFSVEGRRSHTAALLRDFDPGRYYDPMKLRRVDEGGRLGLVSTRLAIDDAGLPTNTDEVGMVLGSATSGVHSTVQHLHKLATGGPAAVPAMGFANTIANAAASLCSIEFGLRGPNVTIGQKQASAIAAIAFAMAGLRQGRATAFVCGGIDDFEERFFTVHDRMRVLSPAGGGEEASRPFDRRRNGFVLGTGGHMMVLETPGPAARRGARPYGEVLGVGSGASSCALGAWPTEPSGIVTTMRAALADAGVGPADIDVVFASANSTSILDRVEAQALAELFGPRGVPVVSIKGAVGEFGASGGAALMAALVGLSAGVIPPTLGCEQPDPACPVDVSPVARPARGRLALINATADGGAQYCVVARAAGEPRLEPRG